MTSQQQPLSANPDGSQSRDWQAFVCALLAVTIWGWWMSATRVAATQGIAPLDVAFLRYSIPALMLAPIWLAMFRKLRKAPVWSLVAMLGWGAPFLWLVTASLQHSNVIYMATIVPCTMPLFAVMVERLVFKHHLSRSQKAGFLLIALAALLVLIRALARDNNVTSTSIGFMLLAAAGWSAYVVAFRHTGLTAPEGTAWVSIASSVAILLVKLATDSPLLTMSLEQFFFQAFAQGVLSGFLAVILYTFAIERLGAARAASFTVLMPAIGVTFAWIWLGETPSLYSTFALALGMTGVAVVNGLIRRVSR